jgi:hypothetical protein
VACLSTEEQVILLSAGTRARRETLREQSGRFAADVDWTRLTGLLAGSQLLPTLGPRIVELIGVPVPGGFASTVERAVELGRRRGAAQQMSAAHVMDRLAEAEISSTALKGPMLSEALYGDPGRRLSGDIDLLVAPERLYEAVDVLNELGYERPGDYVDASGLPLLHFAQRHSRDSLPPVELHWRIHWYERRFAPERLLAPAPGLGPDWRPAPGDELAALLLFYARDGFLGLRHATDLSTWWDRFGAELPADALAESMRAYPALEPVLRAAVLAAERTVGLPSERLICRAGKLASRGRIAVRLAEPHPRSSRVQMYVEIGLIDGLLAPAGGFRAFLRRQVAPPGEVVRKRVPEGQGRPVRSTVGHSVRVLPRYGLALTRLLPRG